MDQNNLTVDSLEKSIYSIKLGDVNYEVNLKKAEEFKEAGNQLLKQNKFSESLAKFTEAIEINIETKKNSIYLSNRALIHIKMENYGLAVEDSSKAIKIDPDYIKAYYRRASANLVLNHLDDAIADLELLIKKLPQEDILKEKLTKAKSQKKKKMLLESLKSDRPDTKTSIDKLITQVNVESSYSGQTLPEDCKITSDWVKTLISNMKNNVFIHKKYLMMMILRVKEYYEKKDSLIEINVADEDEFTVCGDVHGQFYDLLNIFEINGYPSEKNPYLFNGDFVDRGSFSVEIIITLLAWKILYPEHFHMARGNHESRNLNKIYGFEGEVVKKYDKSVYDCFSDFFCWLPLAHTINKKILVVHGGLFSKDGVTLDDIKKIQRNQEPPEQGLMCEILWADPCKMNGRHPSKRGVGLSFGPDIAKKFLDANGLNLLIRSHEVKDEGYEIEPEGKVITIFSAPNYCDQMGNKGALIRLKGKDLKPNFVKFSAVVNNIVNKASSCGSTYEIRESLDVLLMSFKNSVERNI